MRNRMKVINLMSTSPEPKIFMPSTSAESRLWRPLTLLAGALVVMAMLTSSCTHHEAEADQADPPGSAATSDDSRAHLFSLPEDQMAHVQVVAVEPTSLPHVLRLPGTVAYNSFETTPVISQVSGPISRILIVPGEIVHAGQPMLYVTSPDFAQLRTNFLKARDAKDLAQKSYARAEDLYQHHVIATADLEQAESTESQAEADLQAADQALVAVGIQHPDQMAMNTPVPEIPVLAPIAGEAVERLVAPGQVIQAGATQIFTISNMSTVWVLASVYERDMGSVHNGDEVTIESDAYPEKFHGKISYIGYGARPHVAHAAGAHRHAESGREIEEGHVRHRHDPGRVPCEHSDRAGFSRAAGCGKPSLCLCGGQPESVWPKADYRRRERGRQDASPLRPSSRGKSHCRRQFVFAVSELIPTLRKTRYRNGPDPEPRVPSPEL